MSSKKVLKIGAGLISLAMVTSFLALSLASYALYRLLSGGGMENPACFFSRRKNPPGLPQP